MRILDVGPLIWIRELAHGQVLKLIVFIIYALGGLHSFLLAGNFWGFEDSVLQNFALQLLRASVINWAAFSSIDSVLLLDAGNLGVLKVFVHDSSYLWRGFAH